MYENPKNGVPFIVKRAYSTGMVVVFSISVSISRRTYIIRTGHMYLYRAVLGSGSCLD
jgi:hypothetical protein